MDPVISRQDFELRAGGRRLRARRLTHGPACPDPDAPVLVFLHEALGSIGQWKDYPDRLCTRTGLAGLVYERWGFGGSEPLDGPRPADYLDHESRDSLAQVLEQCGIRHPILVGHSDGGTIALMFAAFHPQWPLAIITEAAHVFVEDITLEGIRQAGRAWRETDLSKRLARYHGPGLEAMFRGWHDTWLSPEFRHWDIQALLPRIVCPSLILQGENDEYGTPAQVAAIIRGVSGPARGHLLPDCAHVPHLQARERVLAEMADFIAELD